MTSDNVLERQIQLRNEKKAEKKRVAAEKRRAGHMSKAEQTQRLNTLKNQFLKNKRLDLFALKLFDIALDDDHPGQMAAMKMIADRVLPTAGFASDSKKSSAVQINISGLQISTVSNEKEADAETVSIQ
jgi:hypothetical protein